SITPNAYMTSSFWRYLAEFYSARQTGRPNPGVGAGTPFDYRYLLDLFGRPSPPHDCEEQGDLCLAELRWLDQRLREGFGAPLHELYTRFIGTATLYGESELNGRAFGATNSTRWRRELFDNGCHEVELTPEEAWHTGLLIMDTTSAQCFAVALSGFGGDVNIEVTIEGTENSWRVGDLSAIAARTQPGESNIPMVSEPQRADPRTELATNTPAADWLFGMPDDATSYVIVTNVADNPAEGIGLSDLTIHIVARHEYVRLAVDGAAGDEEGDVDSGPTPAEIDQPIEFEVADGEFSVVYDAPWCRIWLQLRSQQGDALWVGGKMSAPIVTGTYLIGPGGGGDPGVFGGDVFTSHAVPEGTIRVKSKSGIFGISSVNPALIVGRVETQAGSGDLRTIVHAEFSLPPLPMEGFLGPAPPDHPCLVPAGEIDGTGGGTGQGQSGTSQGQSGTSQQSESGDSENDESGATGQGDESSPEDTSDSEDEIAGFDGFLEFPGSNDSNLDAPPQTVQGTQSPSGVTAASPSFDLVITLPFEKALTCFGQQAVMLLLIKASVQDNVYVLEIDDAQLDLKAERDFLRLELGLEDINVVILADAPGSVTLTPGESGRMELDVRGAALQATAEGSTDICENLIDFSFQLGME
ncbi:MAG TPA: hypothetical protein VJ984_10410, partial [Xanthomonadales bacterium]|nr:hypothetical protein [Xanthomonadales bacterium]